MLLLSRKQKTINYNKNHLINCLLVGTNIICLPRLITDDLMYNDHMTYCSYKSATIPTA